MKTPPRKAWWNDGLRFACQGSGKCCVSRDDYGYVYLTLEDRRRLAAILGMPTREFTRQHCTKTEGLFHLDNREAACMFMEGTRCSVYEGRPTQCRTWPFWPENMKAKRWETIAEFCPGVGQGATFSADAIRQILKEQRRSTEKL